MVEAGARHVVIVGGGSAGWMTAAALAKRLPAGAARITLVESPEIGTVGVGEATLPVIQRFNRKLEIDEDDFLRETKGTVKLGIEFVDWRALGDRYFHPFGGFSEDCNDISLTHYLVRGRRAGLDASLPAYSVEGQAAYAERFERQSGGKPITYGFHFDAGLYADFLSRHAKANGVEHVQGRIVEVVQSEDGAIDAVLLSDGRRIDGDLFIDCSGFIGLLIERTLKSGYDDWSRWLPVDRAWAVPTSRVELPTLFTRATAREAGWQWRIPLQHRTGNGYVFSSRFIDESEAAERLLARVDGEVLAEPRLLRFVTGARRRQWIRNCVAIGLSGGFLEPLESTSLWFIQYAIGLLIKNFPREAEPATAEAFNAEMMRVMTATRDFIIAHYACSDRDDSELWRYFRALDLPDSLADNLERFRSEGIVKGSVTDQDSWFAVLSGMGVSPHGADPRVEALPEAEIASTLKTARSLAALHAGALPRYDAFLARFDAG